MISTDPQADLQKLIYDTLKADAVVTSLSNDVYDMVEPEPWGDVNGYISFGPADVVPDDADCIIGGIHTFQIDCWSRQNTSVHCKRMVDAVYAALHDAALQLTDNALVQLQVILRQTMRDPDGRTTHGIIQVEALIEEEAEVLPSVPFNVISTGAWVDAYPWDDDQVWIDTP